MSEFDTGYKMGVKEARAEIEKLRKQNKIMREALEFYADDYHIRDYGNGQQVILEDSEVCLEDEDIEGFLNKAGKALKEIGELWVKYGFIQAIQSNV